MHGFNLLWCFLHLHQASFTVFINFFYVLTKGFAKGSPASSKSPKERNTTRNLPKRSASSVGKSSTSGMGMRSVSVGMLNQAVRIQISCSIKQNLFWLFNFLERFRSIRTSWSRRRFASNNFIAKQNQRCWSNISQVHKPSKCSWHHQSTQRNAKLLQ